MTTPSDPDELVRWAETYGHPEEWAKTAQQLYAENERLRGVLAELADDPDGHGGFAVRVARTALRVELPPPALMFESERLRNALLAIAPLADVPGTPGLVAQKLRGIVRDALAADA